MEHLPRPPYCCQESTIQIHRQPVPQLDHLFINSFDSPAGALPLVLSSERL